MITYELAKQLKDAGFPQKPTSHFFYLEDTNPTTFWCINALEKFLVDSKSSKIPSLITCPTLSEIIKECGNNIKGLQTYIQDGIHCWIAFSNDDLIHTIGLTQEEAVARLWLELNKK